MSRQNEYINSLAELNNLMTNQSIEARGSFPRRGELGASFRTLHLTVLSVDEYSRNCLFIDEEGERWTSYDIYNIVEGDSLSWIKYIK